MAAPRLAAATLAGGLACACAAFPDGHAPVTAQRPTLSSDTATTAVDSIEAEAGVRYDPHDTSTLPVTLKLGAGPATELFVGAQAFVHDDRPGEDDVGYGETWFGVRHRLADETETAPSFALQGLTKLPTGDPDQGLGSGELDFGLAAIATKKLTGITWTAFYEYALLGDPGGRGVDNAHAAALAAAWSFDQRTGGFAELAGVWTPERESDPVFTTFGLTYAVRPSLVFDLGATVGLNEDAPELQLLLGMTYNFGRVLPSRTK